MPTDPQSDPHLSGSCPLGAHLRHKHLGALLVVFGLLLWARFLLVTGHPRTAIADPPQAENPTPVAVSSGVVGH
jgi:hypothetical protein